MAKKQTRRSVSLNRDLFEQAKSAADRAGVPLARFAEDALRAAIAGPPPVVDAASANGVAKIASDQNDPVVEYDQP